MSNAWVCTPCGALRAGCEPFEEKSIGGAGPRTCVRCGATKERMDGMHLVTVRDDEVFTPLQIINELVRQLNDAGPWLDRHHDELVCIECEATKPNGTIEPIEHKPGCDHVAVMKAAALLNEKMAKTTAGPATRGPRESAQA